MTLIVFAQENYAQYADFVNQHESSTPYHSLAWVKAVESSYGYSPKVFGLFDENKLVAVLPCVLITSLKGSRVLCSLPYCDLGGALATEPHQKDSILDEVKQFAVSKRWQCEYRDSLNIDNDSVPDQKPENINEIAAIKDGTKVRMLYQLLDDVDSQLASFKPKLRSQIKKAGKNGIVSQVFPTPNKSEIDQFYEVFVVNMRDLGSPVHSKAWFEAIFENYGNNAFMVLTHFEGKCVGGGIVIHNQAKAVIPWASTLREYNKLAPNMLLYWEVLSEVIRRGITNFDFGRSSFNEGTYRFKKQWGALPSPLDWKVLENGEWIEDVAESKSSLRALIEKTWQKLPLTITTLLGPKIRKHISL